LFYPSLSLAYLIIKFYTLYCQSISGVEIEFNKGEHR